jgi:hypothetical protein
MNTLFRCHIGSGFRIGDHRYTKRADISNMWGSSHATDIRLMDYLDLLAEYGRLNDNLKLGRVDLDITIDTSRGMEGELRGDKKVDQGKKTRLISFGDVFTGFGMATGVGSEASTHVLDFSRKKSYDLGVKPRPSLTGASPIARKTINQLPADVLHWFESDERDGLQYASDLLNLSSRMANVILTGKENEPKINVEGGIDWEVLQLTAVLSNLGHYQADERAKAIRQENPGISDREVRHRIDMLHPEWSANLAEQALHTPELGLPEDKVSRIIAGVRYHHSKKTAPGGDAEELPTEAMIVSDAGMLMNLGDHGFRKILDRRKESTYDLTKPDDFMRLALKWSDPIYYYTEYAKRLALTGRDRMLKNTEDYFNDLYVNDPEKREETVRRIREFRRNLRGPQQS